MKTAFLLILVILGTPFVKAQNARVDRVVDSCITKRNFNGVVLIAKTGGLST